MMKRLYHFLLRLTGWKIISSIPSGLTKFIIAVAPHTSNLDFIIGVLVRGAMGFKAYFLGKKSLFIFPLGYIFKAMGGIPVDRSRNHRLVEQITGIAAGKDRFILAIAPEGTRKQVEKWRSGFYFIALKSGMPIILTQLDWKHHIVRFREPFFPTGDLDADMVIVRDYFNGIKGYRETHKSQ